VAAYIWDLSGTDNQCDSYAPGHQIHWIHFNHSMREPSVVIPVTASVDDDGLVHIEGDGLSLLRHNSDNRHCGKRVPVCPERPPHGKHAVARRRPSEKVDQDAQRADDPFVGDHAGGAQ